MRGRLLLVDDDEAFRERLGVSMTRRGWEVRTAGDPVDAAEATRQFLPSFVLVDLRIGAGNGLDLIPRIREIRPEARIVVLTGYGSIATALDAVKSGASDYLTKPADADQIEAAFAGGRKLSTETSIPSLDRVEWEHLQRVLSDCDGNVSQAARVLGIDRRSLQRKLARFPPSR
jgi:two-component system response regulator RegA